jgi:hypothetical protein
VIILDVGRCGLCHNSRKLVKSHLVPAAAYKPAQGLQVGTIGVTRRKALFTSKQVFAHFLCNDCEQRFHKSGEDLVLRQSYRPDRQFKLRELLQEAHPLDSRPQGTVYDVQLLLGEMIESYLYFAASIFWRASAHRWKLDREWLDRVVLGPYQEPFRQYLLNEAPFPQHARMYVFIAQEAQPTRAVVPPCTSRIDNAHRHEFYIPGIHFVLVLGQLSPQYYDDAALNGSRGHLMWLCPWENSALFRGMAALIKTSTPVGNLHKWDEGRAR